MPSLEDTVYLAGLFDGEGCIHIEKSSGYKDRLVYVLRLQLAMTDEPVIRWAKETFGVGSIYHRCRLGSRPSWTWTVTTRNAEHLLEQIISYLRVKKAEAEAALEFAANTKVRTGQTKTTPEMLALKESYYLRLRALKQTKEAI